MQLVRVLWKVVVAVIFLNSVIFFTTFTSDVNVRLFALKTISPGPGLLNGQSFDTLFYAHPRNNSPDMQVRVFEPFCIRRVNRKIEAFVIGDLKCVSDFGAVGCLQDQVDMFSKEAKMDDFLSHIERVDLKTGLEMLNNSRLIPGTTLISTMKPDCQNIWHFFNRAAGWWHVLQYVDELGIKNFDRILIEADRCVKRSRGMDDGMWISTVTNVIFAPRKVNYSTLTYLHNFNTIDRIKYEVAFYRENLKFSFGTELTCFEKLVIPAGTSFFVSNFEDEEKMDSCSANAPKAATNFRQAVRSSLGFTSEQKMTRKIVYAFRKQRRRFSYESEKRFQNMLFSLSGKHGYEVHTANFKGSFKAQYETVHNASIMIGIHGQNLVNSMFLPCGASLIEIFPFGFWSDCYRQAGFSGVQYHSVQSSAYRKPPSILSETYNNSLEICNAHTHCRFYYRDKIGMKLTESDWTKLYQILEKVMLQHQQSIS
jgi:hypothetical protein